MTMTALLPLLPGKQSRNMFLSLGFRETGREWFALEL